MSNFTEGGKGGRYTNVSKDNINLFELKKISPRHYKPVLYEVIQRILSRLNVRVKIDGDYLINKLDLQNCEWSTQVQQKIINYYQTFLATDLVHYLLDKMPLIPTAVYRAEQDISYLPEGYRVDRDRAKLLDYYDWTEEIVLSFICLRMDRLVTLIYLIIGSEINLPDAVIYDMEYELGDITLSFDKKHHVHLKGKQFYSMKMIMSRHLEYRSTRSFIIVD